MGYARRMIESSPGAVPLDPGVLSECIEACFACEQTCTSCADACVGEQNAKELVRCIRLNVACADVCGATGRVLSRELAGDPGMSQAVLDACARACQLCGNECEEHASRMEHCRVCAEACRRCEGACNRVLSALAE